MTIGVGVGMISIYDEIRSGNTIAVIFLFGKFDVAWSAMNDHISIK